MLEGEQAALVAYIQSFLQGNVNKEESLFVPTATLAEAAISFRDANIVQSYVLEQDLHNVKLAVFAEDVRFQSALCSANLAFIKSLRLAEIVIEDWTPELTLAAGFALQLDAMLTGTTPLPPSSSLIL